MKEWKEDSLNNHLKIKHGFAFKGEFITVLPNEKVLVTPGNFHVGGGFKSEKFKYYTGEIPNDYILNEGDIVVTMTDLSKTGDTLGYSAKIPGKTNLIFLHNQRIGLVNIFSTDVDPDFVYWLMRTRNYQKSIVNSATGSTVRHTSPSRIGEYAFQYPPIHEQRIIARSLTVLEQKIETLTKQGVTLESLANTIFKRWFVDFEFPNEEDQPYKSSGGKIVASELGEIPEGWKISKLKNLVEKIIDYRGKTPKKLGMDWAATGIPALSAKIIKAGKIVRRDAMNYGSEELYRTWMKDELRKDDILLTSEAPLGEMYYLCDDTKYILSQRLFALRTNTRITSSYLYFYLSSFQGQYLLNRRASGSTVQGIRQSELREVEVLVPKRETLEKASSVFRDVLYKQFVNSKEIETLIIIRDTLLPKLMSGEIRLKNKKYEQTY